MPQKTPVTSDKARFVFYDIESVANAFTLAMWDRQTRYLNVFWTVEHDGSKLDLAVNRGRLDKAALGSVVLASNPALPKGTQLLVHDLAEYSSNRLLGMMMGLSTSKMVCNPRQRSGFAEEFRPVCDTDEDTFDPTGPHPYLAGYNSYNYDTTMLATYFSLAMARASQGQHESFREDGQQRFFAPVAPSQMRRHNDQLFSDSFREYMPGYLVDGQIADGQRWDSVAHRIRAAWMHSGRHIDVAMFNEVQRRVALKRGLGGLGRQILESDRLGHDAVLSTPEEFYDLIGYNVSDVVGLGHLFDHPIYSSAFDLKNGLLQEYPETRYEKSKFAHEPNISPYAVRSDRLGVDSTSAKFVARILAPYSNLPDIEAVSFMYPAQQVADELGITRRDVLDECRDFFEANITDPAARAAFGEVYAYYDSIRGRNFNSSPEYAEYWKRDIPRTVLGPGEAPGSMTGLVAGLPAHLEPIELREVAKRPLNIPYFHADGSPSTCFATFSTGGIHGAEADWDAWRHEVEEWDRWAEMIEQARQAYPDPKELVLAARAEHDRIELPDGSTVNKSMVLMGSNPEKVSWRRPKKDDPEQNEQLIRAQAQVRTAAALLARQRPDEEKMLCTLEDGTIIDLKKVLSKTSATSAEYRQAPTSNRPELFEPTGDGGNKLKPKYTHTSVGPAIHEDFSSYYPNMLRNMRAFYNPDLGEDRYAKILADKDRYGKMMKDPAISPEERERLSVLRSGTKLILNSASGAADTTFAKQPIRMNNQIISMRLIGQLFAWMIGQAQTLAGGSIVSTNTDGLYAMATESASQDKLIEVLARQQEMINVEIEPEPLIIVTKDANNRLEMLPASEGAEPWETTIISGSGGTLACLAGPRPDKSLAHPAVRDHALARYLQLVAGGYVPSGAEEPLSMDEPLNRKVGMQILIQARDQDDPVLAARLFQNIIAASNSKITIPFAADPIDPIEPDLSVEAISNPRPLQHYNRVFYAHAGKPGAVSLRSAGAWAVSAASRQKREDTNHSSTIDHQVAVDILRANGYARTKADLDENPSLMLLPMDQDVQVRKISQIDPQWNCLVHNDDLHTMDHGQLRELLGCLDLEVYLGMLADVFEKNWKNSGLGSSENDEDQQESDSEDG